MRVCFFLGIPLDLQPTRARRKALDQIVSGQIVFRHALKHPIVFTAQ
jgi:hypothetical protein